MLIKFGSEHFFNFRSSNAQTEGGYAHNILKILPKETSKMYFNLKSCREIEDDSAF